MNTKEEFFAWLDEWAKSRGLLSGLVAAGLGEPYDFASFVRAQFANRQVRDNMAALLRNTPTRLLYPHAGNTDEEKEILAYHKGLIESDPKWFTHRIGGSSLARMGQTDEGPIDGLIVVPPVNMILELPRAAAIRECEKWLRTQANLAVQTDHAPEGAHNFG